MAQKKPINATQANKKPPVVAEMNGRGIFYEDDSFEFKPRIPSGVPLYLPDEVSRTNAGYIKESEKSLVMRVQVKKTTKDAASELMAQTYKLTRKIATDIEKEMKLPEMATLIGETPHARVFLNENNAVVQMKLPFDEINPKVADIIEMATPEQLSYIKQYLEPESILQNEFYALCALIRKSKEKGEANKKCNTTKQKKVCQK